MKEQKKKTNSEEQRQLTAAEQRRNQIFETKRKELLAEGYREKDLTVGIVYANIMSIVFGIPLILPLAALYIKLNPIQLEGFADRTAFFSFGIVLAILIATVIHELIHGTVWAVYAKEHFKSIEFGFIKEYLTPYCCCKDALPKIPYIIGSLAPTFILGIIPCVIAIISGSGFLFVFGCLMILSGGGDMTITSKMLCYRSRYLEAVYLDHPYKCGLVVFEK